MRANSLAAVAQENLLQHAGHREHPWLERRDPGLGNLTSPFPRRASAVGKFVQGGHGKGRQEVSYV